MKYQIWVLFYLGLSAEAGTPSRQLCVLDQWAGVVDRFNAGAEGEVSPTSLFGWLNQMEYPTAMVIDATNGEVLVANLGSVTVYNQETTGNAAPIRSIVGDSTRLVRPVGIAVDAKHDEIIVVDAILPFGKVIVFPGTATGDIFPLRVIEGRSSHLVSPQGVALDIEHDEIFVVDRSNSVIVHRRDAEGDAPPLRVVEGVASALMEPAGIAVDLTNDEILVANLGEFGFGPGSVTVYPRCADGSVRPLRRITSMMMRSGAISIALDGEHDEIFVVSGGTVLTFPRLGDGQIPPLRQLTRFGDFLIAAQSNTYDSERDELIVSDGSLLAKLEKYPRLSEGSVPPRDSNDGLSTGLLTPNAMHVDSVNGEIWVANGEAGSIKVYAMDAAGDARPIRSIEGSATQLGTPSAIAVDTLRDEVLVADSRRFVRAYPRLANGNVAPLRTAWVCELPCPLIGLAIDPAHGEMFVLRLGDGFSIHPLLGEGLLPTRAFIRLEGPNGIAMDMEHDEIVAATDRDIFFYARSSPEIPLRRIEASASTTHPLQVTVAVERDEVFVLATMFTVPRWGIAVFPRTGNGPILPLRRILAGPPRLRKPVALSMCE